MTPLNFYAVQESTFFRSGQPASKEEWAWVRDQGIREVISLNGSADSMAAKIGLHVTQIIITDEEAHSGLRDMTVLDRIDAAIDALQVPGLVHCTEGKDRTGLAVARFRVRKNGWTKQQALDEWIEMGSHNYKGLTTAWSLWVP